MMNKFNCTIYDKKAKKNKVVGFLEIKDSTENSKAELYIYGDIVSDQWGKWEDEDTCPKDVTDFLKELNNYDDIDIFINSGGGSVFAGIAIYNQLKRHKGYKTVHIDGIAASIASVIACAGDEVIIPKSAEFMIHKPSNSYCWTSLNADELRKDADTLDVCQKSIVNIYMDNVKEGVTEEKINELINDETWFTGDTVTEYFNFKTEDSGEAVACASNYYKKYNNIPRDLNLIEVKENNILLNKAHEDEESKKIKIQNKIKELDVFLAVESF